MGTEENGAPEDQQGAATADTGAAASTPKPTKVRPKAERILPTERLGLAKQVDILRAYGQLGASGNAVSNAEIAKVVDVHPSTASLANAFFVDAGLLSRTGDGIVPSAETVGYARAYEWDAEMAAQKLGPALADAWFTISLVPKVRFRPHTRTDAVRVLAEAAGASKTHRGQLDSLLDFMGIVGLLQIDGDSVKPTRQLASAPDAAVKPQAPPSVTPAAPTAGASGAFQVSMSITFADVALLPPDKIQAFLAGIAELMKIQKEIEEARKQ